MSVVTSFPICCSHPTVPHTSALYWNVGLSELTHVKLGACQCRILCLRRSPFWGVTQMRQRRTALKHVLSWERLRDFVGEPIPPTECSVRDQSRIGAHTAPQSRLWSRLTAGALFWNFVRLMSRSGTDSPYRPSPNEERCNRLVPHGEPNPRSSMQFSSETVREPSMSSYLLRGIPRTSSAIWRVLDKGYTLRSFKLLRNPALNPNQGRRVVSPTGATAVPTPLFARSSPRGPASYHLASRHT